MNFQKWELFLAHPVCLLDLIKQALSMLQGLISLTGRCLERKAIKNRPFSYSEKERESNDVLMHFEEFSNMHKNCRTRARAMEALTPLDRTSCIKIYEINARSRLFRRIAKRSIA